MNWLPPALSKLQADLGHFGLRWAMIGGLAVSLRGEPRTTKDLDVAIAVTGNRQAENVVGDFTSRGYRLDAVREHLELDRLVSVGLVAAVPGSREIVVDLMFATSGIEEEIVAASEVLEVLPDIALPVAKIGHLLALKALAGRAKDIADFAMLTQYADEQDLVEAREALMLISQRGYARGKDLQREFGRLLKRAPHEL